MSKIFPKPLPPLTKESESDNTGFTELEKVTLRNVWRVIKRHKRKHSRNVFLDVYSEYEYFLDYYRTSNGKINMHALHYHPGAVLKIYERLIEDGLDNEALFHVILSEVVAKHINTAMTAKTAQDAIEKQSDLCLAYVEKVLINGSSPTVHVALSKLKNIIKSYLIEERISRRTLIN